MLKISTDSFSNEVREYKINLGNTNAPPQKTFCPLTLGRGSYLLNTSFEYGSPACHALIGHYTSIAHDVRFVIGLDHDYHEISTYPFEVLDRNPDEIDGDGVGKSRYGEKKDQIIIGNDVWVGRGVTVMGGVHIGNGAVIGAGAVVAKDIPAYAVAVGNPVQIIKYRFSKEIIEGLQRVKWWYWPKEKISLIERYKKNIEAFIEEYGKETVEEEDDFTKKLKSWKTQGYKIFYYILHDQDRDLDKHVIQQYMTKYMEEEAVMLVLESHDALDADWICSVYANQAKAPMVMVHRFTELDSTRSSIWKYIDCMITSRGFRNSVCIDYASDYDVKLLYGYSARIFE